MTGEVLRGLIIICVGVFAIWARDSLAEMAEKQGRWHGHIFGKPTPRTVVIWAIGVIIVGIIFLFDLGRPR